MSRPLQVYLEDAELERLETWARQRGWTKSQAVRLVLRNYRDEEIIPTAGVNLKTMFQPDPGAKGAPQSSAPAEKAPRVRAGGGVQILLGDKVTRQPLY